MIGKRNYDRLGVQLDKNSISFADLKGIRKRRRKERLLLGDGEAKVGKTSVHHSYSHSYCSVTLKHHHLERGMSYTCFSTQINAYEGF